MNGYDVGLMSSLALTNTILDNCDGLSEQEADKFCKDFIRAITEFCMYIEFEKPAPWMGEVN